LKAFSAEQNAEEKGFDEDDREINGDTPKNQDAVELIKSKGFYHD